MTEGLHPLTLPWRCTSGFHVSEFVFALKFVLAAKSEMLKSKLPNNVLGKIWKLSDVDKVVYIVYSLIKTSKNYCFLTLKI